MLLLLLICQAILQDLPLAEGYSGGASFQQVMLERCLTWRLLPLTTVDCLLLSGAGQKLKLHCGFATAAGATALAAASLHRNKQSRAESQVAEQSPRGQERGILQVHEALQGRPIRHLLGCVTAGSLTMGPGALTLILQSGSVACQCACQRTSQ